MPRGMSQYFKPILIFRLFRYNTYKKLHTMNINSGLRDYLQTEYNDKFPVDKLLSWLSTAPQLSTFRINTLCSTPELVSENIKNYLREKYGEHIPDVYIHPELKEVVIVCNLDPNTLDLELKPKEVIVDASCGASVLRGANVYAPAVMGMLSGTQCGDIISVYADVSQKCLKGLQTIYSDDSKLFIGNGIVKMTRHHLYGTNPMKGCAIEMISRISGCPSNLQPDNSLLQNIPSVLACYALNAQPNETVLDMCAAPGNKTSHIAALMNNKGLLIALDKTQAKVNLIKKRCEDFSITCVKSFVFDATKAVVSDSSSDGEVPDDKVHNGPPFQPESFDRILLDAPCSALGQRPQLVNKMSLKQIRSFPVLQKKLFKVAVQLLKTGGSLVYSTCTVTLAENESLVAWALRKFPELTLKPFEPKLAKCGLPYGGLSEEHCQYVQRFGLPNDGNDTVGFFIALFEKREMT